MRRIDRFDKYMEYKGLNDNKVTIQLGISVGTLGKSRKENRDLSDKVIELILNFYTDIDKVWLLTGVGDMISANSNTNEQESIKGSKPRIPQTVAAGYLTGFADAVSKNDCEMVPVINRLPDYDYTIIVKGNSMEPKFEGGDEIAIKKVYSVVEGGKAYVLDTRDGAILKRLYDEGDTFRCVSYNNEYQDFHINKSDIFGIYRVVGLIRI